MTRHRLDWLSLLVGLLGVSVAVAALTDLRLGALAGSLGPAIAVVIGVAVLVAAIRDAQPQPTHADAPEPRPEPHRDPRHGPRPERPSTDDGDATREMPPAPAESERP